jgi:hypothetical protein
MLLYPNEFSLPLMPGYGIAPPPCGMLHVKVVSAGGLKGRLWDEVDPFVSLEVIVRVRAVVEEVGLGSGPAVGCGQPL